MTWIGWDSIVHRRHGWVVKITKWSIKFCMSRLFFGESCFSWHYEGDSLVWRLALIWQPRSMWEVNSKQVILIQVSAQGLCRAWLSSLEKNVLTAEPFFKLSSLNYQLTPAASDLLGSVRLNYQSVLTWSPFEKQIYNILSVPERRPSHKHTHVARIWSHDALLLNQLRTEDMSGLWSFRKRTLNVQVKWFN